MQKLLPNGIDNILDIGCGEGFLLQHLPQTVSYTGIDASQKAIEMAKSSVNSLTDYRLQTTDFLAASVYELPFADKSFDLVTGLEVLEHLETPEKALVEIRRVAKKWVILSVPNEPWFQLSNFLRGKYLTRLGNHPEHINNWHPYQFQQLINKYLKISKVSFSFPWQIYLCEK